jgi:predicted HTH domain antitoxin
MQITLELPDEIARQLALGQDLTRAALEALVAEACRAHRLSDHQAAELLGLSRYELDGFLKTHRVFLDYSKEDFEREAALGAQLWQKRQADPDAARESQDR